MLKTGTIVDATFVAAPSSTKNKDGEHDLEDPLGITPEVRVEAGRLFASLAPAVWCCAAVLVSGTSFA